MDDKKDKNESSYPSNINRTDNANYLSCAELDSIRDTELVKILTNIEVLAVADQPKSKGMYTRILKLQEHGECSGSPNTCPKSRIYIAVSEYGEAPQHKVYRLPSRHNWEFVEWIKLPDTDTPADYIQLRLKAQIPTKDLAKGWWIDEHYTVKVNYRDGNWKRD